MKKTLLSLALAAFMSVGSISAQTTCGIDGGAAIPTAPTNLWTTNGLSPAAGSFATGSLPNYDLVVTMPETTVEFNGEQLTGEFVVGVTNDGVYDFTQTNSVTGADFEAGKLSLTDLRNLAAENGFFEPFIYKNDHFTKTGSGQT